MSTKSNPNCCVDPVTLHLWHHCVHRSIEEQAVKDKEMVRRRMENLSDEGKQKLQEFLNGLSQTSG